MAGLIPSAFVRFSIDGTEHVLKYRDVPFGAWGDLKRLTGLTVKTLVTGIEAYDLDAIVAAVWLYERQIGASPSMGRVSKRLQAARELEFLEFGDEGDLDDDQGDEDDDVSPSV